MNKIITILPNSFESKRDFKDLRKDIISNYQIENIISLPEYIFQPYVVVGTIILQLTAKSPTEYLEKNQSHEI